MFQVFLFLLLNYIKLISTKYNVPGVLFKINIYIPGP
jgi:hypothetical protein